MEGPEEISGEDHIFDEPTIITPLHYDQHHSNDSTGNPSQFVSLPYFDLESRTGTEGRTKRMGNEAGYTICLAVDIVSYPVLCIAYLTEPHMQNHPAHLSEIQSQCMISYPGIIYPHSLSL